MASLGSLVIELAANTARLQSDLGKAVGLTQSAVGKMKSVFGALGLAGGGLGLAALANQAIQLGDELQKGAARAGIGAGEFSKLAAAAKQTDVEMGTLSKGIKELQVSISKAASGSKSEIDTLERLGVSIGSLKGASASQQLGIVADALRRVRDPADRTRIGTELLGRAYLELVPLLEDGAAGINKLIVAQTKLGATFTDAQIKKLADADDAIKRMKASFSGLATILVSSVAPALTFFFDSLSGKRRQDLNDAANSVAALTTKLRDLQTLREKRVALAEFGGQFEREQLKFTDDLIRETEAKLAAARTRVQKQPIGSRQANTIKAVVDDTANSAVVDRIRLQGRLAVTMAEFERNSEWLTGHVDDWRELNSIISDTALETAAFDASLIGDRVDEHMSKIVELSATARASVKTLSDDLVTYAEEAARGAHSALADFLFDPFQDGLRGMLKGLVDTLRRMVAEIAATQILKASGITGFLEGVIGGLFGRRALGGPVSAGQSYLVGERGPELFTPNASGAITANSALGGRTYAPVYNIDARGATMELAKALPSILKQHAQQTKADILEGLDRGRYKY
jgi:uncharacterized phage infection (PIP) family protein YhgE